LERAVSELIRRVACRGPLQDNQIAIQRVENLHSEVQSAKRQLQAGLIDRTQATTLVSAAVLKWTDRHAE
jgi:hypothetical protein